jgi:hypothetical protein
MRQTHFDRVLSVKATAQTERLLEKMYLKIFAERLNDKTLPRRSTKAACFW